MFKKSGIFLFFLILSVQGARAYADPGERIVYAVKPLGGRAEYLDLGLVDLAGRKVNLSVIKTAVFGFKDTERIYSDPQTFLPVKVERDISWWFGKEQIIEDYNQKDFQVTVTKFKGKKRVAKQVIISDGPIYNAILLPFYLRRVPDLKVGWSLVFRIPQKYKANLLSLAEIKINKAKFSTFHFIIIPNQFEIWISRDSARIPIKIKGRGRFGYTLLLKEYKNSSRN